MFYYIYIFDYSYRIKISAILLFYKFYIYDITFSITVSEELIDEKT